jgi:hypothetical protein
MEKERCARRAEGWWVGDVDVHTRDLILYAKFQRPGR